MWGIREKVARRMMFESMVESILMYGAEIWGWQEYEEQWRLVTLGLGSAAEPKSKCNNK
jgi:hypothetical protein